MPLKNKVRIFRAVLSLIISLGYCGFLQAQDLEPRRWAHLPDGINVLGVGMAGLSGDILFDPVLNIEDASFDIYSLGLGYVRSFGLGGKTARIDVVAPLAMGRWEGLLDGVQTSVRRKGLVDPWVRFSINLYGAPALKGEEYKQYRARHQTYTTVGAAISVYMPLGQYSQEYLINLGKNRWTFRPQLGVLHQRDKWQFELTTSVFLHGNNNEFWKDTRLKQDPTWFVQSHAIYSFNQTWWGSISAGFVHGGRSHINGNPKSDDSRTSLMALSFGTSISRNQSLKFTYLRTRTNISVGIDSDNFLLGWSYRWFN